MRFRDQKKRKAVTLSFDDGVTQDIRLVELLNKYGLKCTFNLNSGRFGIQRDPICRDGGEATYRVLPASDVRALYAGHEIAAHTLTHPVLIHLSESEIVRQVEEDRLRLSELAGYEVVGMAYPGARPNYDERVARIIRHNTGIRYARTTICIDSFAPQSDLYCFKPNVRLEYERMVALGQTFVDLDTDAPRIFYLYGHSYELDLIVDGWKKLENFFQLIAGRGDVFYGTNAEVLL